MLAYVLPYALVFGLYRYSEDRLGLPLLPFAACLAAYAWKRVCSTLPRLAGAVLAAAVLAVPAIGVLRLGLQRTRPDTSTQMARWVGEHVTPSARVQLVPPVELPLLRSARALEQDVPVGWSSPWRAYLAASGADAMRGRTFELYTWPLSKQPQIEIAAQDPVGFFGALGTDYVVIAAPDEPHADSLASMRAKLREHSEPLHSAPAEERAALPLFPSPEVIWTWRLFGAFRADGQALEIYGLGG
jgi:hypothetical protein